MGKLVLSLESMVENRITSVSEKILSVMCVIGSKV